MKIPIWALYFFVVLLPVVVYVVANKKREGIILNGVEYGLLVAYGFMLTLNLPLESIGIVALVTLAFIMFCMADCIRLIKKVEVA